MAVSRFGTSLSRMGHRSSVVPTMSSMLSSYASGSGARASGIAASCRQFSVLSSGQGYLGALGHGNFEDQPTWKVIQQFESVKPVHIAAGWAHNAVTTEDGNIFLFGRTHDISNTIRLVQTQIAFPWLVKLQNRLAAGKNMCSVVPAVMPLDPPVKFVKSACSPGTITAGVTDDGRVFTLGSNGYGECGVGHTSTNVWEWTHVQGLDDVKVVDVALGFAHGTALGDNGVLYVWGKGLRGQLGVSDAFCYQSAISLNPVSLGGQKIKAIASGFNHTAALAENGDVYLWGKMQSTSIDPRRLSMADQMAPRKLELPGPATHIACSQAATSIITADGRIWMLGHRGRGTRLDSSIQDVSEVEMPVNNDDVVVQPTPVANDTLLGKRIVRLATDCHHTYAIADDGTVHWWGWKCQAVPYAPTEGMKVLQLAFGLHHNLVMTE